MTAYQVSGAAIPGLSRSVTLNYNALGMLLYKSDVGNYSYPTQGGARPHALQSVNGALNTSYTYDANGNLKTANAGPYRTLAYTSFNLPDNGTGISGPSGTPKHAWLYDESHSRIKETRTIASGTYAGTRVTWALHADKMGGLDFESEVNTPTVPSAANPAVTSNRHYLSAGGRVIGVLVTTGALPTLAAGDTAPPVLASTSAVKLEYWHKDHLGSTAATTDHTGALTARYAYDPFGKRRSANGSYDAAGAIVVDWSPAVNNGNDRGYTGHEHLDDVGLVHMNGRVFDPRLGLFLQADPMTQEPFNLQSFNRYGYCLNNPLTCTDPSGLFNLRRFLIGVLIFPPMALNEMAHSKAGYQIGSIAISVFSFYCAGAAPACNAAGQAAWAAWAGYSAEQSAQIGAFAAISTLINGQIGTALPGTGEEATFWTVAGNTAAHGAFGCAQARMGGGDCGSGFRGGLTSAALSSSGAGGFGGSNPDVYDVVVNTMIHSTIGGIAATAGGGRFADGAQTAAFAYLFNELSHGITKEQAGYEIHKDGLSYFDAVDHWQTGGGVDIRVPLSSLDLSQVTDADFPKGVGQTRALQLSGRAGTALATQLVYGNVTLTLVAPGVVEAGYDRYNFNIQPWSSETFGRNLGTMGGGAANSVAATARHGTLSPGRSFFIQLDGQAKIGPR